MNNANIHRKMVFLAFWVLLVSNYALLPAHGDVIHLKNGGRLEGRVTQQGEMITIEYRGGSIVVHSQSVLRIEKKALAEQVFAGRLHKAANDADACVELAEWAFKKDLNKEYVQALRCALLIDPGHIKARRLLRTYKIHYAHLPDNEKARQKLLDDHGDDFRIFCTEHYRICYNTTQAFAQFTGERLEKLYEEFMIFFEDRNFEPAPLTDRLEVVLFDSAQEFRGFSREISPKTTYSTGFYISKTNRSYFYDSISENNSKYRQIKDKLLREQKKLSDFRQQVQENNDPGTRYIFRDSNSSESKLDKRQALERLDRQENELQNEYAKLHNFYRDQNITVTMHEGTHQLAYNCGIHSRYFQNPTWLVEGLAVFFENLGEQRGERPGQLNQNRFQYFGKAYASGRLVPLKELLTRDNLFHLGGDSALTAYAEAWALFYYLANQKHEKLFDYIFDLSLRMTHQNLPYDYEHRLKDFEKYFGSLTDLEQNWLVYMSNSIR